MADIVFVGGSLVKKGGHNILEPASLAKPILFGPHMFNFRDMAELFLENSAAIKVNNEEELLLKIKTILGDPAADSLGLKARNLILQHRGATLNSIAQIEHFTNN